MSAATDTTASHGGHHAAVLAARWRVLIEAGVVLAVVVVASIYVKLLDIATCDGNLEDAARRTVIANRWKRRRILPQSSGCSGAKFRNPLSSDSVE
jgi:hypothetical protein